MGDPIGMWLFWTYKPSLSSWIISRVAGGPWAHMGVGWRFADGTDAYSEALVAHDIVIDRPLVRLRAMVAQGGGRRAVRCDLSVSIAGAERAYALARSMQARATYSEWQLIQMWAHERLNMRVPQHPDQVVCSEYASRVAAAAGVDLRDLRHRTHDEVTPPSAMGVCQRIGFRVYPIEVTPV